MVAIRRRWARLRAKPVSDMPSGSKMRSESNSCNGFPAIREIAMPSTSVPWL